MKKCHSYTLVANNRRLAVFLGWLIPGLFLCLSARAQTTFNYTGSVQTYTVPPCVYALTVDASGAEGGVGIGGTPPPAGLGGRVQATISVTPGEVLNIYVGQSPSSNTVGWNGGGTAGSDAGGGGGASDIRQGGTALSNRVIVAGGGGGGGFYGANTSYYGGDGGGLTGGDGGSVNSYGGKGGTQSSGGAGGTGTINGSAGTLGNGGNGAGTRGGGGGGGYYGGGGGANANTVPYGGGGGGGSSYTIATATSVNHSQGYQSGSGQVIITPIVTPAPGTPSTPSGISFRCIGAGTDTFTTAATNANTYTWTVTGAGNSISGTGDTATVNWDTAFFGVAQVCVRAENVCDTTAYICTDVTVDTSPAPPVVSDDTVCWNTSAALVATTSADIINWYDSSSGGNLLYTGDTFISPPLTATRTYYAEAGNAHMTSNNVGPVDNTIGAGGGFSSYTVQGLIFDVMEPCILDSVVVYPENSGTVGIRLLNSAGTVLQTTTVSVTVSSAFESVVIPVGFNLTPGTAYRLDAGGSTVSEIYRNSSGAVYPYTLPGAVSITDNTFNSGYYYYFYDWTLSFEGNDICASSRTPVTATIRPPADAGPNATICSDDSTRLTASAGVNYSWSPTTGLSDPAIANPWASPPDTTTYTVTVTDSKGCTTADSVTVFVTGSLVADAGADTIICSGDSVSLMANGGTDYAWSPAAGLSCTNCQSPIATPDATTTYTVTVSSGACTPATDMVTVTVQTPPATAGPDRSVCEGDSVQLTASGGDSYLWSPSTGLSDPAVPDPWAASPEEAITYTVTVTDSNGCTATDATTVSPLPPPVAGFTVEVSGGTVYFTSTSTHATNFSWDFGDGNTASAASSEHIYEEEGTYWVCLNAENDCGSEEVCDSIMVSVTSAPTYSMDPRNQLIIYPNPVGDYLYLQLPVHGSFDEAVMNISIIDMKGSTVLEIPHHSTKEPITMPEAGDMPAGMYIIKVWRDKAFYINRFVKSK